MTSEFQHSILDIPNEIKHADLKDAGTLIVAAAGNKGDDLDVPGNDVYPAEYESVMCVAGVNESD